MRGNYREAIVLRFGLGLTVPEIARHLQISLPAAKKLVLRATRQVKKRLEAIEGCGVLSGDARARPSLLVREADQRARERERSRDPADPFQALRLVQVVFASLHDTLHEFGSSALFVGASTTHMGGKMGVFDQLANWAGDVAHGAQAGAGKLRLAAFSLAAFKVTGAFQSADARRRARAGGNGSENRGDLHRRGCDDGDLSGDRHSRAGDRSHGSR